MENLVVTIFQDKDNAVKSLTKLTELNSIDDIVIYNIVMIQKKGDQFQVLYHEGPDTQDMPAEDAFVGSLAGGLAGPLGMALGMLTGVMVGAMREDDYQTFYDEFLEKVNSQLQPGGYAIVMDVEESGDLLIDSYLKPLQASITRTAVTEQYTKYDQQKLAELNKEIEDEEEKLRTATKEDKLAIKSKIEELKTERERRNRKLKTRMQNSKKQLSEKIQGLKEKLKTADNKRKERLEAYNQSLEEKLSHWSEVYADVLL
jgi:uncharacterized membrane protein